MRITKKDLQVMFNRFLKSAELDPKQYILDHISCYGGYVVERQLENGGCDNPFGSVRMRITEMYNALYFAARVQEERKYQLTNTNNI